ncbi:MAG: hypothetical protein J6I53_12115 [Treponema sp.]|nr:hypothetical protein [Treponema sp.]
MKIIKNLFSLSSKQFLVLILPLVIVAMFTCVSFSIISNKSIQTSVLQLVDSVNEKLEDEVLLTFEPVTKSLDMLSTAIKKDQDRSGISNLVNAMEENFPQCRAVYYGTAEGSTNGGYFIIGDNSQAAYDSDHIEQDWFVNAKDYMGEIYMSAPYISQDSGELFSTFSKAIYDDNDDFIGVLAVDMSLTSLMEIVEGINLSVNTVINFVDENGVYLTNSDPSAVLSRNYIDETKIDKSKYNMSIYFDNSTQEFVQGKYFFAVRKIGLTPWFAVIEGEIADFNGSIKSSTRIIMIVVAILILACVLINATTQSKTNEKEKSVSSKIFSEMQNLIVAAKENAATAQDQSAAVKEIVATMEDNTSLSENISKKIVDVAAVAKNTSGDVVEGVTYLEQNVNQLTEIAEANQKTIEGIKSLGDKIENIWDIVTLINSVADQAKIIAFNAELEASSAGEAGRNFHIVATEIRRLADGIIDGTKEIKSKITEIQQSSDTLIIASENGTEKIQNGVENAKSLEERFTSIKNASEVTAGSAGEITTIIQQQAMASEQILITLKQIAAGVENFSSATENISQASQNLKMIAGELTKKNNGGEDE